MSESILNDYLNAKAAFETRARLLFKKVWPRFRPLFSQYGSVSHYLFESGAVELRTFNDDFVLIAHPTLFSCTEEEVDARMAEYPPEVKRDLSAE